jgi:hypothetical protein
MDVYLDDKKIHLDWGFPEKISQLKKRVSITLDICFYIYNEEPNKELEYLKTIVEVPNTIYVSKSDYYWWVFENCKLIDKHIQRDKNFYDYKGRDIHKWNCKLTFSYKDVYGSNKKNLIDREIKLKQLFGN